MASYETMRPIMANVFIHQQIRQALSLPREIQTYSQLPRWITVNRSLVQDQTILVVDNIYRRHYADHVATSQRARYNNPKLPQEKAYFTTDSSLSSARQTRPHPRSSGPTGPESQRRTQESFERQMANIERAKAEMAASQSERKDSKCKSPWILQLCRER